MLPKTPAVARRSFKPLKEPAAPLRDTSRPRHPGLPTIRRPSPQVRQPRNRHRPSRACAPG